MNPTEPHRKTTGEPSPRGGAWIHWLLLAVVLALGSSRGTAQVDEAASPRQLYNDGTRKLQAGKLQEAEACLQGAIASQDNAVQPPALYNLGSVRFRQGAEQLKKGPQAPAAQAEARDASDNADTAIQAADAALAGEDVASMLSAYMQGRGARKELKAATEAVKTAMDTYGGVLAKWQRAAGDFKSAHELAAADQDAQANADTVDRSIARLIDQRQIMMQAMMGLNKQREKLGKKLAALKKKLPPSEGKDSKGKGDDDDDDDDKPSPEPKAGQQEPENKSGGEMYLTPEEAARLLGMLKLDADRKLPVGMGDTGKPKQKKGRDW